MDHMNTFDDDMVVTDIKTSIKELSVPDNSLTALNEPGSCRE